MHDRLWFVTDGVSLVSVHTSEREAEREYEQHQSDPDFEYYDFYEIDMDELEDYPEEYDLALEQGLID